MEFKDLSSNPVAVVLQLVGAKWKILIVKNLLKKGDDYSKINSHQYTIDSNGHIGLNNVTEVNRR